jgi:hypothetical protein
VASRGAIDRPPRISPPTDGACALDGPTALSAAMLLKLIAFIAAALPIIMSLRRLSA